MIIFPAIDLFGGKAVRLYKGDYSQMTVYSDSPLSVARDFQTCGAKYIHLVDLEGAKEGSTPNIRFIKEIVNKTGLFAEVGGGIRNMETVEDYVNAGVGRVILGTAAVNDKIFLKNAVKTFNEKIAVGADISDGFVAIKGWTEKTSIHYSDFLKEMEDIGVSTVIMTDISKDGAMKGCNLSLYEDIKNFSSVNVIASGGVSSIDDVKRLRSTGIYGAIIGKAYYTGAINLKKAIEVAAE